jgi:hypothetical protein
MLCELRAEHQKIQEAIWVLQRVATGGGGKRRGRPPKWLTAPQQGDSTISLVRKRKPFSAATRKRIAEAQRKRWAAKKGKAAYDEIGQHPVSSPAGLRHPSCSPAAARRSFNPTARCLRSIRVHTSAESFKAPGEAPGDH